MFPTHTLPTLTPHPTHTHPHLPHTQVVELDKQPGYPYTYIQKHWDDMYNGLRCPAPVNIRCAHRPPADDACSRRVRTTLTLRNARVARRRQGLRLCHVCVHSPQLRVTLTSCCAHRLCHARHRRGSRDAFGSRVALAAAAGRAPRYVCVTRVTFGSRSPPLRVT
eukprot:1178967-Prorocentrum_minimum.AAC.1